VFDRRQKTLPIGGVFVVGAGLGRYSSMVKVVLANPMVEVTGGQRQLELAVDNFRELTQQLLTRWPQLEEPLQRSAVAIDGQIYQDAFAEPLDPKSEVFFMPRIEGG
jgi:molybdopterin converting factor small subunit